MTILYMNGENDLRSAVTLDEVREFKRLWYLAARTGEVQKLHLDKGRKVEDVNTNTTPQEVGIKEETHVKDILLFKARVGTAQMLSYLLDKEWRYLDEDVFNSFWRLKQEGLVIDLYTPFPPSADVRISDRSYVIWTHIQYDEEVVKRYLKESQVWLEEQIGKLD